MSGMQGLMALHSRFVEQDFADRARLKAEAMEAYMHRATASGLLGDGRLADMADVEAANLLNPDGLFLGAFQGRMLFFNGDESLLTYLRTGGGKGRDLVLPTLAHSKNRSLIVIDVKDAENAYASQRHRAETLKSRCVYLNPFGLLGLPNTKINPLQIVIDLVRGKRPIGTAAKEIAEILLPPNPKAGDNAWVRKGAVRLLALRIEWLARFDPDKCSLAGLWEFPNAGDDEMDTAFAVMASCGVIGIERRAKAFRATWANAEKQFEAYKSEAIEALDVFELGNELDIATSAHEFDFSRLKHEPHTVYLTVPSSKLSVAAPWISLIINYAIETIAQEAGALTTTFLLDEFPQLPPAPAILKALRLYRGKGIQMWFFAQGRFSMEDRWSRDAVKEIEDQAGVMTMKHVQSPELIRDIQMWSGNTTILTRGKNHSGGKIETASDSLGETKRPVLQSEDILGLGERQIIKVARMPRLFVCDTVPFYRVDPWKDQILDVRRLHRGSEDGET
ncbi:type IV secretory system conjugative DNA transfer family protein [Caulobacter soli]|uniref:type IV secretory system conjugative DNA transfer family protein n=1 Tax=Caulobacter soli TaxID=2708539 RepID=UPI0013EDD239|nr:type IV secretory system conjugative DNA transfer family protein [Caulobacter soli]